ncbi:SpvB/TcaC N-terminal domain-containing protein, partial [Leucothrix pacifica]
MKLIKSLSLITFTISIFLSFSSYANQLIGSLEGEVSVEQGVASWNIGIDVPSGVNGIAPSLGISYHQSASNGPLGIGFSLEGLSSITRCPATEKYDDFQGGVRFNSEDRFCLDGQRLIAVEGSNGGNLTEYRTAIESYTKVVSYGSQGASGPKYWKIWAKDGIISEYGNTSDAQVTISNQGNAVLLWMINRKSDRFDNTIDYTYDSSSSTPTITKIDYSGHKVTFNYSTRRDKLSAWQMGDTRLLEDRLKSIDVFSSGGLLRSYKLKYDQVGSGYYSRLADISMCTANYECTKPTEFTWKESLEKRAEQQIDVVEHRSDLQGNEQPSIYRFVDLDRDGDQDVCYINNALYCGRNDGTGKISFGSFFKPERFRYTRHWPTSLATKWSAFDVASTLNFSDLNRDSYPDYCLLDEVGVFCGLNDKKSGNFGSQSYWSKEYKLDQEIRYADINNDKLIDICRIDTNQVVCSHNLGKSYGPSFVLLNSGWGRGSESNSSIAFIDSNGDGLVDLCGLDSKGYRCALRSSLSGSSQFSEIKTFTNIVASSLAWSSKTASASFRYSDLNVDGLADFCLAKGKDYLCSINTGDDFLTPSVWGATEAVWEKSEIIDNKASPVLSLMDINGDSRPDLCVNDHAYEFHCGINNGSGFVSLKKHISLQYSLDSYDLNGEEVAPMASPIQSVDIDGNGGIDICYRSYSGLTCALGENIDISLLVGVKTAYGNETKIEYDQLSNPELYTADNNAKLPVLDLAGSRRIVSSVSTSDGIGGFNKLSFQYEGLKWHLDEGSLGFRKIIRYNNATNRRIETTYLQNAEPDSNPFNAISNPEFSYFESFDMASNPSPVLNGQINTIKEFSDVDGVLELLQETNVYHEVVSGIHDNVKVIRKNLHTTKSYDSSELLKTEVVDYEEYDDWGSVKRVVTTETVGAEVKETITTSTYSNNAESWIFAKPLTVKVQHYFTGASDVITRQTSFTYYDTGALHTKTVEPGSDKQVLSTFSYDKHGNRTSVKVETDGEKSRTSITEYDNGGLHPKLAKNALNHSVTTKYDSLCGLIETSTDANKISTTWQYDGACRKKKEIRADKTATTWVYKWSEGYDSGYGEVDRSVYSITTHSSGSAESTKWYDGLGREVRSKTIGFDGRPVYQDTVYQKNGQVEKATLPYFEGEFPGDNTYWVRNDYDELGRTIAQYKPNKLGEQVTRYAYEGNTTTITDPLNRTKSTVLNVFGKPSTVTTSTGSNITYTYDAIGNLAHSDTNGYVVSMEYDNHNNKIYMNDPSMGEWRYDYNGFGELIWQKDAKKQVTTQKYDVLGRMYERKVKTKGGTTSSHWIYDKGNKGNGKLYQEKNGKVTKTYSYDNLGRAKQTSTSIDGKKFVSKLAYDQYSRPSKETYPDKMEVHREYTEEGFLKRISIPKKNVYDYDYTALEETLETLIVEVARLSVEAAKSRAKFKKYIKKADRYRLIAESAELRADAYKETAAELREQAKYLSDLGEAYLRRSEHFSSLVDHYSQKMYKDLTFSTDDFTRGKSDPAKGYILYKASICTAKDSKGDCTATQAFNVQIAKLDFTINPSCENRVQTHSGKLGTWSQTIWCSVMVPSTIDLAEFYTNRSNSYSSVAKQKAAQSNTKTRQAASKERSAGNWEKRASRYKELAIKQVARARKETKK